MSAWAQTVNTLALVKLIKQIWPIWLVVAETVRLVIKYSTLKSFLVHSV